MFFDNTQPPSDYEILRKEFYRLWLLSHQVSRCARNHKRQGKEEEFQAAMAAFRVLAKQAKEVRLLMESAREPRPMVIDTDIAVEEDMRLTSPELFLPPEQGGFIK